MRFSEDKLDKLLCSDGVERTIHIWEPAGAKMVFVAIHGGMAHAGDYVTPALWFKEHGIATVSFDMQGHDQQKKVSVPSFQVFLDDLDLFIEWTQKNYPTLPIVLLGHSMGGLILTHYGLNVADIPRQIKGFVLSSPYYGNAIKTPAALLKVAGLLSKVLPKMAVPIEDIKAHLTHDEAITLRHHEDERDGIRASQASARFANELLVAQEQIRGRMQEWEHPLFVALAGQDKVADTSVAETLLSYIEPDLLEKRVYEQNYHENFNEVNREEIYQAILQWLDSRIL